MTFPLDALVPPVLMPVSAAQPTGPGIGAEAEAEARLRALKGACSLSALRVPITAARWRARLVAKAMRRSRPIARATSQRV